QCNPGPQLVLVLASRPRVYHQAVPSPAPSYGGSAEGGHGGHQSVDYGGYGVGYGAQACGYGGAARGGHGGQSAGYQESNGGGNGSRGLARSGHGGPTGKRNAPILFTPTFHQTTMTFYGGGEQTGSYRCFTGGMHSEQVGGYGGSTGGNPL
ncbi:Uncharacterized protein APZ42_030010, partial [Daphnia magna]